MASVRRHEFSLIEPFNLSIYQLHYVVPHTTAFEAVIGVCNQAECLVIITV